MQKKMTDITLAELMAMPMIELETIIREMQDRHARKAVRHSAEGA